MIKGTLPHSDPGRPTDRPIGVANGGEEDEKTSQQVESDRWDRLEKTLVEIRDELRTLNRSCHNMDRHISFVESIMSPLNAVMGVLPRISRRE